jgi:MFS family permease
MILHRSQPLLLVALLASFVINLDTTLVNVALPTLTRELGATTAQLQPTPYARLRPTPSTTG